MTPVLLVLLLLLPLILFMGRKAYGKAGPTGSIKGDGEGDPEGNDLGPG